MKLVPLNDYVVIRPQAAEVETAGGIVLPDSAQEQSFQGRVLAVGDGLRFDGSQNRSACQVQEGDRILYSRYAGSPVTVNGEELIIMSERQILAILR
ncbi:MAG: co-chaperone GroES [Planctomycetia bacterium]|nr:co-chaperone GroES [Planctomycetia bacterium]